MDYDRDDRGDLRVGTLNARMAELEDVLPRGCLLRNVKQQRARSVRPQRLRPPSIGYVEPPTNRASPEAQAVPAPTTRPTAWPNMGLAMRVSATPRRMKVRD